VLRTKIVIAGGGIAGLTAADALRTAGFDGDLTIVGDESRPVYSRPALSKALLRNEADVSAHDLPAPEHDATELRGVAAAALHPDRRVLLLDDGTDLGYDGLVIATGSRARRLGAGADEFVLRTLDDALLLRARMAFRPDVLIVGGGPLGMEVASGALEAGCRVTLVASEPPLSRHLGVHLSRMIVTAAVARGLTLIIDHGARVIGHGGKSVVRLGDGRLLDGELLLTAVGDIPNTGWLAGSGVGRGGALEVDSRGRLRPDIVAAGDVAAVPTAAGHARSPIWQSAIVQARVAAVALLEGDAAPELHAQPYFWTEQFDLTIRVAGLVPLVGAPEIIDGDDPDGPALLRWRHGNGTATAVSVNYRIPIPRLRRLCESAA
jgi:NADPH-dependent 2,4-dienoyl-CoA reductase/sulfur reductase-like enzyme